MMSSQLIIYDKDVTLWPLAFLVTRATPGIQLENYINVMHGSGIWNKFLERINKKQNKKLPKHPKKNTKFFFLKQFKTIYRY